jgi:hypothetical protein
MPLVLADRVRQTTNTVGTGTLTLVGTVTGFQSFAVIGNGNTTYYTIVDANTGDWEVGLGTYTSSGTTLSRTTVLASSNSNNLVVFGAGTKDVFVTYPAGKSVYEDESNNVSLPAALSASGSITGNVFINTNEFYYNGRNISQNVTIAGTENAMSVGPITIDDTYTVTIDDGGEWVIV